LRNRITRLTLREHDDDDDDDDDEPTDKGFVTRSDRDLCATRIFRERIIIKSFRLYRKA
jgi:hypothetical protein